VERNAINDETFYDHRVPVSGPSANLDSTQVLCWILHEILPFSKKTWGITCFHHHENLLHWFWMYSVSYVYTLTLRITFYSTDSSNGLNWNTKVRVYIWSKVAINLWLFLYTSLQVSCELFQCLRNLILILWYLPVTEDIIKFRFCFALRARKILNYNS